MTRNSYQQLALTLALLFVATLSGCKSAQITKRARAEKAPTTSSEYQKITGHEQYAASSEELFGIYQKEGKYYFDIPTELIGRDMLIVNRILTVPPQLNEAGINKGINYENTLIRMELAEDKKQLVIRHIQPQPKAPEGDKLLLSIAENFVSPIMGKLKVSSFSNDSTSVLVEVTKLYDGSSKLFNNLFDLISVGGSPDTELSQIKRATAFKNNITVVSELTTKVVELRTPVYLTVEVASSILLLPEQPMAGRYLSPRVGYFTVPVSYYADAQNSITHRELITRWRLEPSDKEAYLRGEHVEPVKPIVFYIDPATPERWRKYMKQGIEDWQVAFERAGFKNAIIARESSEEINPDDLSHSSITYIASEMKNAMGPSVYDPRSGEIIQADIIWWHNVLEMLRNWLILQTGAQNPEAASWDLPEDLLGDAMRFVACHEVGHSLGLRHNMIASSAYTIQQLRDPQFTAQNGTAPSIMDYARFNYIAQPEDGVTHFSPEIGPYDLLAIEYGYRWYGEGGARSEVAALQQLLAKHTGPLYRYSEAQDTRDAIDPRAQTEDLGDDPVAASTLGIANLKRLMPQLLKITKNQDPHQGYREAGILYNALMNQWNTFIYHPMALIGGIYLEETDRSQQTQNSYHFVPKEKQREAAEFLIRESIIATDWLFNAPLLRYTFPIKSSPSGYIEQSPTLVLKNAQSYIFWDMLSDNRLIRMSENEYIHGDKAFKATELTDMLYKAVFGKSERGEALDVRDRFVQKGLVDALLQSVSTSKVTKKNSLALTDEEARFATESVRSINFNGSLADRISDAISIKRELLLRIRKTIGRQSQTKDPALRGHYQDLIIRIDNALEQ
ncbi:peptidase M10A/M12B [Porphyromonas sp. HMSC077F02]|uniref:zinc-dependent metalloprotease n=1 Tax=Porphyromonas sp. HMSC077F02 TaxID=1739529 RepID=UPI0008A2C8A9|nr:zinc-dependent metalloprotease [Porphyromonas sp. HMSC077F02]OFO51494.1 peptidase M10A/M12B [Porphyromonas sp. HMSC077F02]